MKRDNDKNLLEETLQVLDIRGLSPDDVEWVGVHDGSVSGDWDDFAEIAKDINYYSGYGGRNISADLVVVGDYGSWWLSRREQEGMEWWDFHKAPPVPPPSDSEELTVEAIPEEFSDLWEEMGGTYEDEDDD